MATAGVADGLFYSIVFEEGHNLFIRYFESGVFQGFFENLGLASIDIAENYAEKDTLYEKIFTEDDLKKAAAIYNASLAEKRKKIDEPSK